MTTRTDALNEALDRLTGYDYLDGVGFACHGPMAAEALSTLGYDDRVGAWVEAYRATHPPIAAPSPSEGLDPNAEASWRSGLGDFARVSDWQALFARELQERPWPEVVGLWVPRLLAGCAGGLTHGLIRTAHAVRAMPEDEPLSGLMLDELAKGLALWAAVYQTLPGQPTRRGSLDLQDAVARLPRPPEPWTPIEAGTFSRLHELDGFVDVVDAVAPPGRDEDPFSELTGVMCRVLLTHPDAVPIGLVHAVTPVAAMRTLVPYLAKRQVDEISVYLWHIGAAIVVGFGGSGASGGLERVDASHAPTPAEVAGRAADHRDPHAIKFTEACLRENALRPDPIYLLAAQHALDHIPAL